MIAPVFYPHIGGVEKHIKRVSEELIRKENEVTVLTQMHDQYLADFDIINKIRIFRFHNSSSLKIWLWIYRHRELIKSSDVIHCHDFAVFILWYLPFRFLYYSKPSFITFHGYEGNIPIPKSVLILRKICELLTKGNICIGDYITKWYGTKPSFITYGGVDLPLDNNDQESHGTIFIGRLERDTGVLEYIETILILKAKFGIEMEMEIYGDGGLRKMIEEIIAKNNLKIRLNGFVENPMKFLAKSKFAFVSGYLAILEAMINKKLVLSIYTNEIKKDYLRMMPDSDKIMVIASSAEELAGKIEELLNNQQYVECKIKNAFEFAKRQTWESETDIYIKLWEI